MKGERALMSRGTKPVLNEPLPPAVAILRRNRYNWAPRGRRLGHCSRIRGASEGRRIVVCIRDGDRYRRRGRELRVRMNFFRDDLITIMSFIFRTLLALVQLIASQRDAVIRHLSNYIKL